jgi:hypothetical protein
MSVQHLIENSLSYQSNMQSERRLGQGEFGDDYDQRLLDRLA